MANLASLKYKETMLTEKLAKLRTGEMLCEEVEGDGRQEEAIARNEQYLRGVKKEIAALESAEPKK